MPEPLKNQYGVEVPRALAGTISCVYAEFDSQRFLDQVLADYAQLELMDRGRCMAAALRQTLPSHYPDAIEILLDSMNVSPELGLSRAMSSFFYLPHSQFVGLYGLPFLDESLAAMYQITQKFTAEFCVRPFIEAYPEALLQAFHSWAQDDSEHVRRLVSEGLRPRLPWASRLRAFEQNPAPVLQLLAQLKDDSSLYVRRSVANHLNDISKDHPGDLLDTVEAWMVDAPAERQWLIRHALRSLVKRGDRRALSILGYGSADHLDLRSVHIAPTNPEIGQALVCEVVIVNTGHQAVSINADLVVHFRKANKATRAKVFKIKSFKLDAGEAQSLRKKISLAQMSTRTLYPGVHHLEILLNGEGRTLGEFVLAEPSD